MGDTDELQAIVPTELQNLVPVFLDNRTKDIHSLTVAIAAGDFEMLRQIGHRMTGSGSSYGFPTISALGSRIEQCAKVSDRPQLIALLAKYRHYLANVKIRYQDS